MPAAAVRAVVDMWAEQVRELERDWRWVQVFENRGTAMGASSPHPHGQIWANASMPDEPSAEDERQLAYAERHGRPLLADYADVEEAAGERLVVAWGGWLAVVPFWAVWPFETLLLPRRPVARLPDLADDERDDLVAVLRLLLAGYDALFDHPFPYSMGWHGAPSQASRGGTRGGTVGGVDGGCHWQLHAHFYPPLLRSPTIRKFLVGYEMFAGVQRDFTPEVAAARLRAAIPAVLL
jgi:UDPglucose--hexose-1-phosphate uridylyltransferase